MLSDEEKKAIDDLFALTHINGYIDLYTQREVKIHTLDLSKWQNGVKVLLNLFEKQQKEIEELKEKNKFLNWYFENQKENFIHKDKIKARIEELEKLDFGTDLVSQFTANLTTITILQSLLEKE